ARRQIERCSVRSNGRKQAIGHEAAVVRIDRMHDLKAVTRERVQHAGAA
ncbi:MAG: hypothetical protein QOI71_2261, partial [Gaiellales bacterium]|nr:hypothetical protein [Gaiellales bacterium]